MMNQEKPSATAPNRANMDSATISTLLMVATITGGMAAVGALVYLGSRIRKHRQLHKRNCDNLATLA